MRYVTVVTRYGTREDISESEILSAVEVLKKLQVFPSGTQVRYKNHTEHWKVFTGTAVVVAKTMADLVRDRFKTEPDRAVLIAENGEVYTPLWSDLEEVP